jgi:protein-L-isoaspartate(D-aspartate) O-methyltransferase
MKRRGITDKSILTAMRKVERHRLVQTDCEMSAYEDRPLPIGHGQTISQPYIVAYMTEQLKVGANSRVLEIGCGSGYQAAVLAEIVNEVASLEIVRALAQRAHTRLLKLGYRNIQVRHADGFKGWSEKAPFDAIIVTAAAEEIPPPLIDQLAEAGRIILPIGPSAETQVLILGIKRKGQLKTQALIPVRFVPFVRQQRQGEFD